MTLSRDDYFRVTQVLDVFSGMHMVKPDILEASQTRGTNVDLACKSLMQGIEPFELEPEYEGYLKSFKQWAEGKRFIPNPGRMYCDPLIFSGECDGIYESDEGLVLFDIKTAISASKTWRLQGGAYCYLAKMYGYDIKKIEFVRLSKEGKEAKTNFYDYEHGWNLFSKALEVHTYFFEKRRKAKLED